MTYIDEVYSFHCRSANECGWDKEAFKLKLDRVDHVFLTVPSSLVENCTSGKSRTSQDMDGALHTDFANFYTI